MDPFSLDRQISTDRLINICKYRQGTACCRYVYVPRDDPEFYCAKQIEEVKNKIDDIVEQMTAKGDNCIGLPDAER